MSAVLPPLRTEFAFLGLGSNLEDRLAHLQDAVDLLDALEQLRVDAVSSVYETEPVGGPEQDPYYNMAVRVATRRSPRGVLAACQEVERRLGRVRTVRWGSRTIDVDILLYGGRTVRRPYLQIPHPRLVERAFALIPLIEVAPGMVLPGGGSLSAALAGLAPVTGIRMIRSQVHLPAPGRPP
ncbi:MAG: 2-amino-4-hydroxy-6-hydroxymethyldihydropteridine diphosphokinase [Actinomycetota bacterium]|nr:2-amino-4-hydroxy-6-hydroxymethyldihydropteridine diphosphokinase [Actinomycetota bacterium]